MFYYVWIHKSPFFFFCYTLWFCKWRSRSNWNSHHDCNCTEIIRLAVMHWNIHENWNMNNVHCSEDGKRFVCACVRDAESGGFIFEIWDASRQWIPDRKTHTHIGRWTSTLTLNILLFISWFNSSDTLHASSAILKSVL